MPRYKSKPIEVDAEKVQDLLTTSMANWTSLPDWVRFQYELGNILFGATHLVVTTLNGSEVGNRDDWLTLRNGSLRVMKRKDLDDDYEAM